MRQYDLLTPLSHGPAPEFISGQGAALRDAQGNEYLDFNEICVTLGQGDRFFYRENETGSGGGHLRQIPFLPG